MLISVTLAFSKPARMFLRNPGADMPRAGVSSFAGVSTNTANDDSRAVSTLTASLGKKMLTVPARTDVLTVTTSAVACRDGFCLDGVAYCSGSHR